MDERLHTPATRLGQRMIVFALDSGEGRARLERILRASDSADATAMAPAAWLESAMLWVGLRLSGSRLVALR